MAKMVIFVAVMTIALSLIATQEANALVNSPGERTVTTTASLNPSKVCGVKVCEPGQSAKWFSAVQASQREGTGKAIGGYYGHIIMHQLVVNNNVKQSIQKSEMTSTKSKTHDKMEMKHEKMEKTVKETMNLNTGNQATGSMNKQTNMTMNNQTSTNSTG